MTQVKKSKKPKQAKFAKTLFATYVDYNGTHYYFARLTRTAVDNIFKVNINRAVVNQINKLEHSFFTGDLMLNAYRINSPAGLRVLIGNKQNTFYIDSTALYAERGIPNDIDSDAKNILESLYCLSKNSYITKEGKFHYTEYFRYDNFDLLALTGGIVHDERIMFIAEFYLPTKWVVFNITSTADILKQIDEKKRRRDCISNRFTERAVINEIIEKAPTPYAKSIKYMLSKNFAVEIEQVYALQQFTLHGQQYTVNIENIRKKK